MTAGPNPYKTQVIGAPTNDPDVEAIEATVTTDHYGRPVIMTVWEPSEEEVAAINRGERIWMFTMSNRLPPACIIVGDDIVKALLQ